MGDGPAIPGGRMTDTGIYIRGLPLPGDIKAYWGIHSLKSRTSISCDIIFSWQVPHAMGEKLLEIMWKVMFSQIICTRVYMDLSCFTNSLLNIYHFDLGIISEIKGVLFCIFFLIHKFCKHVFPVVGNWLFDEQVWTAVDRRNISRPNKVKFNAH